MKRRYTVRLVGEEIANLDDQFDLPAGYSVQDNSWQLLPALALDLLVWLPLGFSRRRFVQLGARWRGILIGTVFLVGASLAHVGFPRGLGTGLLVTISVFVGLATALLMFFILIALEWSVRWTAPVRFASLPRLFDRRVVSEPCGLAIVRGCLIGLALLGADAFLVWLGTGNLPMRLDWGRHLALQANFLGRAWPEVVVPIWAVFEAVTMMILVGFLASVVARFLQRGWAVVVVAAILSAVFVPGPLFSFAAVHPYHWKLLLLVVDCLVLVWAFTRFDLLTLLAASFTFAFCWQNYSLLVMLQPTGALTQWIAFAVGGFVVLAAAIVAFQTQLRAAYRRVAAAFE